jgi:hypothetical protein
MPQRCWWNKWGMISGEWNDDDSYDDDDDNDNDDDDDDDYNK